MVNQQISKQFAQLCESVLLEYSTTMDLIRKLPGGKELIQTLHQDYSLSHDQKYKEASRISWSELKDSDSWVILQYRGGVGAIKHQRGGYTALASTNKEPYVDQQTGEVASRISSFTNDRGGNIMDFLKGRLGGGNPQKIFIGKDTGQRWSKERERREKKQQSSTTKLDNAALLIKFKPLWSRAISAAIADIKGMINTMIKNDSFGKATEKIQKVQALIKIVDSLESGQTDLSRDDQLRKAINKAVLMAASYYYPEDTGEISRQYGSLQPENYEGPNKLLTDLSAGDNKKLGTVLSFFKQSLIS